MPPTDLVSPPPPPLINDARGCFHEHLCWDYPLPIGSPLRLIDGSAENDVWAAGENALVHWDGSTARLVAGEEVQTPRKLVVRAWGDVWLSVGPFPCTGQNARTGPDELLHFDGQGGRSRIALPGEPVDLYAAGPDDVYVSVQDTMSALGQVLHYDGARLTPVVSGAGKRYQIFGVSASEVWFVDNAKVTQRYDGTRLYAERPPIPDDALWPVVIGGEWYSQTRAFWNAAYGPLYRGTTPILELPALGPLRGTGPDNLFVVPWGIGACAFRVSLSRRSTTEVDCVNDKPVSWIGFRDFSVARSGDVFALPGWLDNNPNGILRLVGQSFEQQIAVLRSEFLAAIGVGVLPEGRAVLVRYQSNLVSDVLLRDRLGAWTHQPGPAGLDRPTLFGVTGDRFMFVDRTALHSYQAGAGWQRTSHSLYTPMDMKPLAPDSVILMSFGPRLSRLDGSSWTTVYQGSNVARSFFAPTPDEFWLPALTATGNNYDTDGIIFVIKSGLARPWLGVPPDIGRTVTIAGRGRDDVWFALDSGTAYHYDGSVFQAYQTGIPISGMYMRAHDEVHFIAQSCKDACRVVKWDGPRMTLFNFRVNADPPMDPNAGLLSLKNVQGAPDLRHPLISSAPSRSQRPLR